MATVKELLDQLASKKLTVSQVAADFRARTWPPRPEPSAAAAWGVEDDEPPSDDSWALVESDSRLNASQRAVLGRAFDDAHR